MMAQSALGQRSTLMSQLSSDYEIPDEQEVSTFLDRYPDVGSLLPEIRSRIRQYFGGDPVRLEVFSDPDFPGEEPKLVVNIQTHYRGQEGLHHWHRFNREWWLDQLKAMRAPILVSFNPLRRV
jgi:hypothetical protein